MKNLSRIIILPGLLMIVIAFGYSVWQKEQVLKNGEQLLIRLAPVDPRSLMQGDYMTLNYDMPSELTEVAREQKEGDLVYTKDQKNVATFIRLHDENTPLADNERRLHFRTPHGWRVDLGAGSFFFQEGQAEKFENAKFGELRMAENGHSVLVGLRDENHQLLGLSSGLAAGTGLEEKLK